MQSRPSHPVVWSTQSTCMVASLVVSQQAIAGCWIATAYPLAETGRDVGTRTSCGTWFPAG
jgi:hypothetical protein